MKQRKIWTLEELDYIEKYYLIKSDKELAKELNAKESQIRSQRYKYGFKKQRQIFNKNIPEGMKWCWYCKEIHSKEMFSINNSKSDGLQDECIIAVKKMQLNRKRKKKNKSTLKNKVCNNCGKLLDIDMFVKNVSTQDGFSNLCRNCLNKKNSIKKFKLKGVQSNE